MDATSDTRPSKRGRGRPREWTEARIREALGELILRDGRFPREQTIIRDGAPGLRDALQRHAPLGAQRAGVRAWAAALGVTMHTSRPPRHAPDVSCAARARRG